MGTGAMGVGADVRQASLRTRAGTLAGRTTPTPSTAAVIAVTNDGLDWLDRWPSADAQQLSACSCVRTRLDPERCELSLCMGHSPPSAQQAMRASAVGIQPAQIAAFPANRPNVSTRAARRWTSLTTYVGCSTGEAMSNEPPANSGRGAVQPTVLAAVERRRLNQVARNRPAKRATESYASESGGPIRSMSQSRYNFASAAKS